MQLQLSSQFELISRLHKNFGNPAFTPIYGAGCIKNPKVMFLFMNPTGRNVSAVPSWNGIRAPWLGTKSIWKMFGEIGILDSKLEQKIRSMAPVDWTVEFCEVLYQSLADRGFYITNLAKCTQADARPLPNSVFNAYRNQVLEEVSELQPQSIVSFGNQVSSILLGKQVSVSGYTEGFEELVIGEQGFRVFPCYYPVGQGTPNMPKAIARINRILTNNV